MKDSGQKLENHRLCVGCGKGPVPSGCVINRQYWHPECWRKSADEQARREAECNHAQSRASADGYGAFCASCGTTLA